MLLCGMRLFWNKSDKTSKRGKNINNTLGCASWYVPFFAVISAGPHDMCPFWFLFRLRLMIYALFGSHFGCASWYVPLSCSYFGCASWYVPFLFLILAAPHDMYPFFVLISAAPHDMCPFLVLISAAPHDMCPFCFLFRLRLMSMCPFWFLFQLRLMICTFFFVLISAAPHDMCPFLFLFRLHLIICVFFSFLLHPNVICDLLLRTHGNMGCMCLTEWIQSSSQIEANYWPPQFLVPRALWVEQPATEANASYLISKSHLRKKDLFFCPSRQRWYICNKKDKGSTYWCRWLNFKGKCPSS